MEVYAIEFCSMSGKSWHDRIAYVDRKLVSTRASQLDKKTNCPMGGKWSEYRVRKIQVIPLNENKVEFDGLVFNLNKEDGTQEVVDTILKKLTSSEQQILKEYYGNS